MPTPDAMAIVGGDAQDRRGDPLEHGRLEALARLLDTVYPDRRLSGFEAGPAGVAAVVSGAADPLLAVLVVGLIDDAPRMSWSIAAVPDGGRPGLIPSATREASHAAREALVAARARRDHLVIRTGEPGADRLLDAIAPLFADLLDELTDRQRSVARMLLLDGLRQADVAEALGVSRATVSVMAGRGHVRSIERLAGAIRAVTAAGLAARHGVERAASHGHRVRRPVAPWGGTPVHGR